MARISVRPDSDARQGSSSYRPMAYSAPTPTPVCETPVPVDDPTAEIRQKYFSGLEELVDLHRDVGILNSRVADRKAAIKELEGRIVGLETTVASLVPLPLPPRPVKRPLSVAAVTPAPVRETRSEVVQEPPKKRSAPVERPPAETQKASVDSFLRKPVKEFKVPKRPVEVTKAVPPVKNALNLTYWVDLMEEHHHDFYADLPYREKTRLREDVHEFLCLKLKHNEVKQCRMTKGDGIPRKLITDFNKWVKSQIKAGVFGKGKTPSRRSSLSSNSSSSAQKRPAARPKASKANEKAKETESAQTWKTWAELIRTEVPAFRVESSHAQFVKAFLRENAPQQIQSASNGLIVPRGLEKRFIKDFFLAFPQKKAAAAANLATPDSPSSDTLDSELSLSVSAWSDICKGLFPREMVVISSDLSYELRVRGAVSKFLESRVSRLGLELSDCLKEPTGSSKKTFAIPLAIEGEFIAWFRNQIPGRFETSPRNSSAGVKALETSQNSAPLKRKRAIRIDSDEEDGETLPEPDMSSINLLLEQLCDLPMETTDLLEEGSSSKSTAAEDLPEIFTPERPPSPLWSFPWLNDSHSDHGNVAAAPSNEQTTGAENGIDPSMFEMSSPERGTMKFAAYSILRGSESQVVAAQEQDDDIVLTPDSTPQRAPHNDIGVDPVHLSAKLAKVLFPDNESEKDESENVSTEPASNESLSALEALDDTRSPIQDEQSTVTSEELSSTTIPMTIEDVDAAMNVQETMVMTVQEKLPLAETILITEETTDVSQVNDTLAVMEESSRSVSPILVDEGDVEPQTALPLPSEEALIEKETMSDTPKEDSTIGGLQEGDTVQMPGQEAADSEMSIISVFEKDLSIAPKTSPTCDKEADTLQDFVPDSTENQASLAFPAQDSMSTHDGLTSNIREWAPVSLSDTVEGQTNATPHNAASELVLIDENSDSPASHKTTDIHTHATAETKTEDAAEETDKKGQTLTRYNTILLKLMPGYSKLPRPTRMKFKDTTKTFLSDKLGSKAASEDCVIFIQNDGRKISTIGVPRDLEREYRAMALTELRRMFGFKGVPLQKFELDFAAPLDPIGSEKMDKINELVLSLSKAMRRFMRIRTRYISSLRLEAQTDSPGPLSGTNNTQIENAASHVSLECPELVQAMDLDGQMRNVSPDPDIVTADESTIEVIREDSVLQTLFEISSSPEEQETDENVHCIRGAPVEVDLTISSTPSPVTSHASTSSRASESATPPLTPSRSSKRKRSAVKTYAEPDSPKRAPRKSLESPTMTVPRSKSHSECKYSEEELRDLTRYTKLILDVMPSFSKAPRASRLRVKEHVHTFLESQVGPDGLRDCVTWARTASGEMIPTIGIPKVLEMLFNSWVVGVLRLEFGSAAVSLPSLEEEGQEEEDDEKEAESASVTV